MTQKIPVQLEPCTLNHWLGIPSYGQNLTELYNTYNFKSYLCPNVISLKNFEKKRISEQFYLGGNYNSEHFNHWKFTVSKCSNKQLATSLWKPKCKTEAQISDFFLKNTNVRFSFYTNNFIINPLQNTKPISTFVEDSIFFSLQNNGAYQTADIYFTEYNINTDQSILPFEDNQKEQFLIFQNGNFRTQYVVGLNSTVIADFFVRKDMFSYEISRSFQKISEIISYIGGFSQIFILVTAILVNYYNEYVYAVSLANKIYDFQHGNNKLKKNKTIIQKNAIKNKVENVDNQQQKQEKYIYNEQPKKSPNHNTIQFNLSNTPLPIIKEDIENNIQIEESKNQLNHQDQKAIKLKKIQTRDEVGMLPLDQIKSIITQRKTYIENQKNKQTQKDKLQIPQIKNQNSFNLDEDNDQFSKFHIIQGSPDSFLHNANRENNKHQSNDKFIKDNYSNSNILSIISQNQNKNDKIEYKNMLSDCVIPESPPKQQESNKKFQFEEEKIHQEIKFDKNINQQNNVQSEQDNYENKIDILKSTEINLKGENLFIKKEDQQDVYSIDMIQINSNQALYAPKSPALSVQDNPDGAKDSKQMQSNNNLLLQGLGFRDKTQFLNKEFEFLLQKDSSLKMTFKFFLWKLTCGKLFRTEQVLLLDKANKQMKKDLDIFMIISKLKEIEKLKDLLLDQNQQILFNFFPKPILSVHEKEETISREGVAEQIRTKSDSIQNNKNNKKKGQKQKMMNLSLRTAALVQKAAKQFKKPLLRKINQFNSMTAYKKLYDAYEYVKSQKVTRFNQKLIEYLGEEMNKIFEISNLITTKANVNKFRSPIGTNQTLDFSSVFGGYKIDKCPQTMPIKRKQSLFKQKLQLENSQKEFVDSNSQRNHLIS